jgi:hypothetical protein
MKEFGIRLQPRQKSDLINMYCHSSDYPGWDNSLEERILHKINNN